MTPEADRLMHWMPIVIRASGLSEWERKFCASMIARSRARAFTPSEKQIAVMDRIVTAFQARELTEAESADVIDTATR